MPIGFRCHFGKVGNVGNIPWGANLRVRQPGGGVTSIEEVFFNASEQQVVLTPVFHNTQTPSRANMEMVWPVDLHEELRALGGNEKGVLPIENLGVIFAPKFAFGDDVFGVMFDTGFPDEFTEGASSDDIAVPREGCAVFVDSIRQARSPASEEDAQIAYTVVHELGHLFNRVHEEAAPCFMNSSPAGSAAPDPTAHRFLDDDIAAMARCETDHSVQPGRKGFAGGNFDRKTREDVSELALSVSLPVQDVYFWEPFEMEVEVSLPKRAKAKSAKFPDELDPAFRRFRVWIEEPNGERRLYRPTKHFCDTQKRRSLARGESFRRDISIFGQSGGYTFRTPGIYRVWATLEVRPGRVLVSKMKDLCIKPDYLSDSRARIRLDELRKVARAAGHMFFYRSGQMRKRHRAALESLWKTCPGAHLGASAAYALGRWYEHLARRTTRSLPTWYRRAEPLLADVMERAVLNPHRCQRAAECLQAIQSKL